MSKEKQIEEMARSLNEATFGVNVHTLADHLHPETINKVAEYLYNAGYRKQSEGEWIDRFKGEFINPIYVCSLCGKGTLLKPHINELRNMEMEQALSPFCPNCGAKMKGG